MKKLIIVGGGIQGCTLAINLLKSGRLNTEDLLIIDQHDRPLSNWKRCTETISMPYLRSPSVHHLDLNPFSLEAFSKKQGYHKVSHFYGYYDRPSLEMFNDHCDAIIEDLRIQDCYFQGSVASIDREGSCWTVMTEDGLAFHSDKVVLAMGLSGQPCWSEWALEAKKSGASIHHVFDKTMPFIENLSPSIAVIGGGISGAHLTLKLKEHYPGKVSFIFKKPLEVHTFDSDPGWQGPMYMRAFQENKDYSWRRKTIVEARHKGSITKELYYQLKKANEEGSIQLLQDEVERFDVSGQQLVFKSGEQRQASTVVLTTGFHAAPPGISWLQKTIEKEKLHCSSCGYPIVTPETLEWGENLFVMGPLAELEIGPVSRNIAGARRATERIVSAI
ncbi:FAD/NAD(P)-binding protein [Fictibacillus iocasae]|uniref:FAD/NAD(P)-binding protein n=1 Tax=Fictibacillus iocasae TaxID=2715437 RepID=A0ABW2NSI0_9BACL